jgi:hypothetical protein
VIFDAINELCNFFRTTGTNTTKIKYLQINQFKKSLKVERNIERLKFTDIIKMSVEELLPLISEGLTKP